MTNPTSDGDGPERPDGDGDNGETSGGDAPREKGSGSRADPDAMRGDASLFGNFDLRLFITRFTLIVPGDFGLHGFADVGRVFVEGEDSSAWHPSGGGGIWFAPLCRTNTITIVVAGSEEDVQFYVRVGLFY